MIPILASRLSIQFFLDIVYFPVWWYTRGVLHALNAARSMIREGNDQFVPFLWMRHIFVPMFGQYDWQGRLMSVFMRSVNIVFRLFALGIWSIIVVVLALIWILLPLCIVAALVLTRL